MVQTTLPVSSSSCVPTSFPLLALECLSPVSTHSRRPLRVQMRTATSPSLAAAATAAAFLLLLLTATMEAEAIRLDAESRAAVNQQQQAVNVANKPSQNELTQKDAPGGERRPSPAGESETKRSVAVAVTVAVAGQEVVKATAHKLPEFHEDYYGASVHEPRHH